MEQQRRRAPLSNCGLETRYQGEDDVFAPFLFLIIPYGKDACKLLEELPLEAEAVVAAVMPHLYIPLKVQTLFSL